ncbi:hypothetical protein CRUP_017649 [Coryphaenoides rupestris]|nr:hypothetical protein CRUP_017649 [Coryphaenoides rupestris]
MSLPSPGVLRGHAWFAFAMGWYRCQMPPLPLDERIVVLQRPKNLSLCEASSSSPGVPRHPSRPPAPPTANGKVFHASSYLQAPHLSPYSCNSLSLECKRRLSRVPNLQPDLQPVVLVSSSSPLATATASPPIVYAGYDPSHRHSNGTVSLDAGGAGKGAGSSGHSLRHGGSLKGGKGGKRVSLHLSNAEKKPAAGEQRSHRQSYSSGLQFVPAQAQQQQHKPRREKENPNGSPGVLPRSDRETSLGGSKKSNKLGTVHQNHSSLLPGLQHPVALPHAAVLNPSYPSSSPPLNPLSSSFRSAAASRDHRRRPPILHGLPLSPGSSGVGGFPSPDHTCTVDLSYPFNCGCWELVRRKGFGRGCQGGGGGGGGGGNAGGRSGGTGGAGGRAMGLRSLGGCLSTTSNTSSSNSTASDCRPSLLKPLACASCSSEAGPFESPAMLRKKLAGGCLPCAPSAPLRAIHSCVTGCDPKASQTASSTCSYCSSDPIVVTYNPRRSKPPGRAEGAAYPQAGVFPQSDDDDYSVRTIWPEELAKKMSHSQSQQNSHCAGMGMMGFGSGKPSCMSRAGQNGTNATGGGGMALLDCQNLREFSHGHLTDHAGRRRLWQGKMAALDFMGGGGSSGAEDGRSSLKRLLNKDGDAAGMGDAGDFEDMAYRPCSPSPPQSPLSFSPPPSTPGTLIMNPKPRQRDREREREGGHSLPSAQSLHLVLNSLNRDQDEENSRRHHDADAENAVISAILPFLFLGNERDARTWTCCCASNVGFVVNVTNAPARCTTEEARQTAKGVLVHCQAGVSRSATVVIAYLMKHTLMTMTDAYKYVRGRRPVVSPNLNFMGQLLEFERDLNSGVTPRILTPKLSGLETQCQMPPLPLDERIVVLQRPKNLSLCEASSSSPGVPRHPSRPPAPPTANGKVFHASSYLQAPHLSPYSCNSLSLECKRRLSRVPNLQPDLQPVVLVSSSSPLATATASPPIVYAGYDPSHRHSNGTVTLGPRLPSHTHTHAIDIKVSLDAGGAGKGAGSSGHSLRHGGSLKGGKGGKRVSLHLSNAEKKPAAGEQRSPPPEHPVALPHAAVLNPSYPSSSPPLNPLSSSFRSAAASRDHRRRPPSSMVFPLPGSSGVGGFPSPDHTCTVDLSYPFNCGCWELVRRKGFGRGCQGGGGGGGGGGSPSSSFSCVQTAGGRSGGTRTASDCRPSLLKPLACASCSSEAGPFESPAMLRKKLAGGCLPCAPSAPLRAIHSCVTGCDPKASQTASSTCSYCSSDPIVVTYNPRRSKPPGRAEGAAYPQAGVFPQSDDDDYSVRTIWPEELAKKMSHSQSQQNSHCAGMGMMGFGSGKPSCMSRAGQNGTNATGGGGMALLDCQNFREFSHGHLTDHAGRRRLWQGKMAALDFMGGGGSSGAEDGRSSLKRLLNKDGDAAGMGDAGDFEDMAYRPCSPSPPQSPLSFSPPPSTPGTLIMNPKPRQRDREREREGGHSLPSAQSLHLVLNSLNRDQDEENSRSKTPSAVALLLNKKP